MIADRTNTSSPDSVSTLEERRRDLRNQISDLSSEVNTQKAKAGAALGGAAFLVLLSLGASYDLARDNLAPWLMLGLDRQLLKLIALATGVAAMLLLLAGLWKLLPESRRREARLADLEREYDDLID